MVNLSLAAFNPQVDLHPLVVLLNNAVVLAKRMALPAIGQEDAFHVRMARELDFDMSNTSRSSQLAVGQMETELGGVSPSAIWFPASARCSRASRESTPDRRLFPASGNACREIDAIIELLLVAQQAQDVGNHRAIDREIVLPQEVCASRPEPNRRLYFATIGESHGTGTGPAGLAGAAGLEGPREPPRLSRASPEEGVQPAFARRLVSALRGWRRLDSSDIACESALIRRRIAGEALTSNSWSTVSMTSDHCRVSLHPLQGALLPFITNIQDAKEYQHLNNRTSQATEPHRPRNRNIVSTSKTTKRIATM